jgi:3-oxoacyl-[acyl-carrier protein] reductase
MLDLTERKAIVTGGTRGIGRAIAEALLEAGATVVIASRTARHVERAERELSDRAGERVVGLVCDVSDAGQCERLVSDAVERLGGLDTLVNNAGIGVFRSVAEMSVQEWRQVIGTNLDGAFYCSHYALPHLLRGDDSWIINIGSLAGKNAFPNGAAYNASKFGLLGFGEALMQEVRHEGVRVSTIMPGSVATDFGSGGGADWKIGPEDVAAIVLDLLATPYRTLASRIEIRPSRPPKK